MHPSFPPLNLLPSTGLLDAFGDMDLTLIFSLLRVVGDVPLGLVFMPLNAAGQFTINFIYITSYLFYLSLILENIFDKE